MCFLPSPPTSPLSFMDDNSCFVCALFAFRPRYALSAILAGLLLAVSGLGDVRAQEGAEELDELTSYTVTVAGAGVDRRATVVSFSLPVSPTREAYHLEPPSGASRPLQVGPNRAWFVVERLGADEERTYQIRAGQASSDNIGLQHRDKTVDVSINGTPVFRYWTEPRPTPHPDIESIYERGGYLHPVRTPSGRVITGDYPLDHKHHHGIWSAWTNTEFRGREPDFWNMGGGTGTVEPMALDSTWSGPVQAGLQARHRYIDLSAAEPVTALFESWTLRVYQLPTPESATSYRMFDLRVEQTTASASPLALPTYHYGGVAVRGPEAWHGAENSHFRTSTGRDRSDGNETRARWNYFGGSVEGSPAGIAMLGHPDNFRAPQPLRLHPEMPYFTFAPSQLGLWTISPGHPYEARYRFVTFDGHPDPDVLDRLWADYAYPPAVTVQKR